MQEITIFTILYGIVPLLLYKIKNFTIKPIEPFIWVIFIASLYEFLGTFVFKLNSEYWFICYMTLAFFSIHWFFYKLLNTNYFKIFTLFIILFLVLSFYSFYEWDKLNYLDIIAYFNSLQTVVVLFFSILWIVRVFTNLELDSFTNSSMFYFVSGLILYYSGTVFLFLLSSFIFKMDKSNFQSFWMLNIFLNLVLRTLLIVGIWKGRQQ
jgi:hypothetical protein